MQKEEGYSKIRDNNSITISEKSPLTRLWAHRARKFLYTLIHELDKKALWADIQYDIVNDTIICALEYIKLKRHLKVYLYDICLACFWLQIQQYGLTEISINRIIRTAKKVLGHKITHGKILKVISHIRNTLFSINSNPIDEIRRQTVMILDRMFADRRFIEKKFLKKKMKIEDVIELKLRVLNEVKDCILALSLSAISGVPRKVISAIVLYIAFRKVCDGARFFVSSGDIEKYSGVCRFTILRKYKKLYEKIEKR